MSENLEIRLRAFGDVAFEFCGVVDAAATIEPIQLLRSLERVLATLHQRLLELPMLSLGERDEDIRDPSDDERTDVYQALKQTLGKYDTYRTVFDSKNLEEEAIHASLANDLTDIYFKVLCPIRAWKKGADPVCVIGELRLLFYTHWGRHLLSAQKAILDCLSDPTSVVNAIGTKGGI